MDPSSPQDIWVSTLLVWKGGVVAIWFALFFLGERLWPAAPRAGPEVQLGTGVADQSRNEPRNEPWGESRSGGFSLTGLWRERRRLGTNIGLWLINSALSLMIVIPVTVWAADITLPWASSWQPQWWPQWRESAPGLVLDILVLDFLIYWWHRANHVWPLLWRFHEVHHLDQWLDTTSAVRFHCGEVLLSALARAGIILALGLSLAAVLIFEALILLAALFHHSNLRLPPGLEGVLSRCVITPSIHWVHHHALRADTDSNYGTIFSFWDPLFASRSLTARHAGMAIGVENRSELPLPGLLASPFRSRNRAYRVE